MTTNPVKRRLAAILAADVAEYSRMMGENEEAAMRILSAHRGVLDSIIAFHDGRIANTAGDSVLAEFASPVEAVRAAVEIQDALKTRNDALPEAQRMWFRIGLNLGDVMAKNGDLLGDGVNIAARLQALAEPGGICLAASILEQIEGKLNLHFLAMGEQTLKNISRPVKVFRLDPSGIGHASFATAASSPVRWKLLGGVAAVAAVVVIAAWLLASGTFSPQPAGEKTQTAEPTPAMHAEMLLWESVRDSDSPAELQRYLDHHPDGRFAQAARARIASLARAQTERSATEALMRAAEHTAAAARETAEATRAQAQIERTAAERLRREAEQAAAKAKEAADTAKAQAQAERAAAERSQQELESATAAAKERERLAALPPPAAIRNDGIWQGEFKCSASRLNPPFNDLRRMVVTNGAAVFERGAVNTPGWLRAVGKVGADGSVTLHGEGISGMPNENAVRYFIKFTGRFDGERFVGDGRFGGRDCTLNLARIG